MMNNKKKRRGLISIMSIALIVAIFVNASTFVKASELNEKYYSLLVSSDETNAMKAAMETRGFRGRIEVEILYDCDDQPSFLLGTSGLGYQIISRGTLQCIEGGEANPYQDYPDCKKYYGGILNYYVMLDNKMYDICRNRVVQSPLKSDYLDDAVLGLCKSGAAFSTSASARSSITYSKIINHALTRIQKKAFGYNNDNTCAAVACTIALEYLDCENPYIVPSNYHLELLSTNDPANIATDSPKAHAFHRFLADDCYMGPVSFGDGITFGIDMYRQSSPTISNTDIDCTWTLNIYTNFGINELLADRPILLTSTIAGSYSVHTMAAYGYRRYDDNSLEWLIHSGWYSSLIYDYDNGYYRMPEIWVAASTATLLYRFTYDGMDD